MAKSKILKELANNEVPLDVALKRLLIICDDLDYKELFSWAEKELNGYFGEESVPEYRNGTNLIFWFKGEYGVSS